MCGRATLATPKELLRELFKLEQMPVLDPRYNIAPSQDLAVIREPHKLELLRWGLVRVGHARGINVRAETAARAPQYRDSFRARRCLVIVDGFFEWKRGSGKQKQPFLIHRDDARPFALAGIWDTSADRTDSCAIITGPARGVVAALHDRMPIIVQAKDYARWLDSNERNPSELLVPDAGVIAPLVSRPVCAAVNDPRNDEPGLLEPIEPPSSGENLELF
jgi:putative SOS response-associated peptidase YedK